MNYWKTPSAYLRSMLRGGALLKKSHRARSAAFTLVELLVVIAIGAILAGLASFSIIGAVKTSKLNAAAEGLVDELNLARQTALTQNTAVEVRFYLLPDVKAAVTAAPTVYRAVQLFKQVSGVNTPVDKPLFFPSSVICLNNATDSSLVYGTTASMGTTAGAGSSGPAIGPYGNNYSYVSFHFKSSGTTDLIDQSSIVVALVSENDANVSAGNLPKNYFVVQIDAVTGHVRFFRP